MHKPLLAAIVVGALLLSGCAEDPASDPAGAAAAPLSQTLTSTGPPPKPPVFSDTLHFMAAPDMVLKLPVGGSDILTPTDTGGFGGGGGGPGNDGPQSQWSYQVLRDHNTTGATVHVWIQVHEQMVQGAGFPPTQNPCTWFVVLEVGSDSEGDAACVSEPIGPIAPGIKELVFDFPAAGTELEANETITVRFGRTVFSPSPNNAVSVLSGSAEHDSRLVLPGLKEIVPEAIA